MAEVIKKMQEIPIISNNFNCRLEVDGEKKYFNFAFRYNAISKMWFVDIKDINKNQMLLNGLPLVPSQDLLEQYKYKNMGSAYLIPRNETDEEYPSYDTLKNNWALLWGDSSE